MKHPSKPLLSVIPSRCVQLLVIALLASFPLAEVSAQEWPGFVSETDSTVTLDLSTLTVRVYAGKMTIPADQEISDHHLTIDVHFYEEPGAHGKLVHTAPLIVPLPRHAIDILRDSLQGNEFDIPPTATFAMACGVAAFIPGLPDCSPDNWRFQDRFDVIRARDECGGCLFFNPGFMTDNFITCRQLESGGYLSCGSRAGPDCPGCGLFAKFQCGLAVVAAAFGGPGAVEFALAAEAGDVDTMLEIGGQLAAQGILDELFGIVPSLTDCICVGSEVVCSCSVVDADDAVAFLTDLAQGQPGDFCSYGQ